MSYRYSTTLISHQQSLSVCPPFPVIHLPHLRVWFGIRSALRLTMAAMERSSTNFIFNASGSLYFLLEKGQIGMLGLRNAPLKITMKRNTPKTVPRGEDLGRLRRKDMIPLHLYLTSQVRNFDIFNILLNAFELPMHVKKTAWG